MIFRDGMGNAIEEGDAVAVALGQGQIVPAKIVKLTSGLGAPNTQQSQPAAHIAIVLDFAAAPNGVVPGVIKIASPGVGLLACPENG